MRATAREGCLGGWRGGGEGADGSATTFDCLHRIYALWSRAERRWISLLVMSDSPRRLRILGFEPFDAGAHKAVRESISRHSRHEWLWLTRPGRAVEMAHAAGSALEMIDEALARGMDGGGGVRMVGVFSIRDSMRSLPHRF